MFTKTSIALAVIVALTSGAFAVEKRDQGAANTHSSAGGITLPSTSPEGNRTGWFGEW
jgi:hypothetical protein